VATQSLHAATWLAAEHEGAGTEAGVCREPVDLAWHWQSTGSTMAGVQRALPFLTVQRGLVRWLRVTGARPFGSHPEEAKLGTSFAPGNGKNFVEGTLSSSPKFLPHRSEKSVPEFHP
jgi:hypothetical protein